MTDTMTTPRQQNLDAGSMDTADFQPSNGAAHDLAAPPVRLNLGSGRHPLPGWDNIDRKDGREVYPLEGIADNSVDLVRASHILEHFGHRDTADVLAEWVRVLKPGGILKIAVPDFEIIAQSYLNGEKLPVQQFVMGSHEDRNDYHGAIFDEEELTRALRTAGLWHIQPWQSEIPDCAALPISLNLQGRKKKPVPTLKVACAMSVPRLGFMENFFCWARALQPLGIVPCKYEGAFWGQCLERVMTDMMNAEFILTVDYDTVFDRHAIEDLLRLAADCPEADAIAPLQIRRGSGSPMATIPGPDGKPIARVQLDLFNTDLLPVATAHFGLTLLRVEALKKVPHPWFIGIPAADGNWGEGRIDDDVNFWKQWTAAGNTLFLAPHVAVAHAELMLTWPGRGDLRPVYQHPSEFWTKGIPDGVWK